MDIIGIVGIDGSGKSSFSDALSTKIKDELDGCKDVHQLRIPGYVGVGNRTTHVLGGLYKKMASFGHKFSIPQEPEHERFDLGKKIVSTAYKLTAILYNSFIKYHSKHEGLGLVERVLPVDAIVYADEYDGVNGLEATTDYMFNHFPEWPKAVIWVKPESVDVAYQRIHDRARELGTRIELHETREKLEKTSNTYHEVLEYLGKRYRHQMPVFEITSSNDVTVEEMAEKIFDSKYSIQLDEAVLAKNEDLKRKINPKYVKHNNEFLEYEITFGEFISDLVPSQQYHDIVPAIAVSH
ncbi:MAG: hypothetical protein GOU99_00015 [Candidatus Altiarchaeota archaeon]|nr:hypothetical protein [Candidatus Altiarchaeota archaeon]